MKSVTSGASATQTGLSSQATEPSFASPPSASIPCAAERLRENAEALNEFMKSFDEHVREEQFWGRWSIEQRVADLFQLTSRLTASLHDCMETTAQAIDARSGGTACGSDPKDESAVPATSGDAS